MSIPTILVELTKTGVVKLTEETVKTFVETKIKPIFINWGKDESRSIELEECLSEYLIRCYAKNNIMTTIVFGRVRKTLEDLYIPLTLEEYKCEKDKSEKNTWVINEDCYDILDCYNKVLIIDMAGMGKSTIVKYFACQGVNLDKCIPIVIELRRLEKNQTILEYIQKQINSYDKNIEIVEIVAMLRKGDFVVFLDGYDEIANENKSDALDAIQDFTSKTFNTKIVITSREEDDLNSLGEYKCVNIKPLTEDEAYELIEKYDNDGEISKKLIRRLRDDSSMNILNEFLKNPLLVSLLYKTFEYKEEIPYKKIDFYEQVYAALFNDHDKTKGSAYVHEKKTKLDRFQFEQILRAFGFLSLKEDKIEYSDQLIYQLLEQSIKRFSWLKISVDDFLYDITHAVPFIQKDGNEYKWVHKSFMEYFASCFICYDNKEIEQKYLERMISSKNQMKYFNVLDFCYEMDTLGFRKFAILPYIDEYIKEYQRHFNYEYFNGFDKQALNIAKYIRALNIEIYAINNIYIDQYVMCKNVKGRALVNQMFEKSGQFFDPNKKMRMLHTNLDKFIYVYEDFNSVVYKLISERLPELFEEIYIEFKDTPLKERGIGVKLTDDIDNPINKNKYNFKIVVENMFRAVFEDDYKILDYNKCKKLKEEIILESQYTSNDIFDL